jgi:hypothetical protein
MSNEKVKSIIIDKVENGFFVRPYIPGQEYLKIEDVTVFTDTGSVCTERENQELKETLYGWLDEYFT